MGYSYNKIKSMFLQQSYQDATDEFQRILRHDNLITWDYLVITASNERQAQNCQEQITERLENGRLPKSTKYIVLPDLEGKRIGSGGATLNILKYIAENEGSASPFAGKRILVIHSGGDSKRIPQYSARGKLFSPIPRELPDGRPSTLFDELVIGVSVIPSMIREGMLVLSGDVLLLFNPLQIDFEFSGAAAISVKMPLDVGVDHGVYLNNGNGFVSRFLHKHPADSLRAAGAVNEQGFVDLDTGAVIMDSSVLNALYDLICTDGVVDPEKFSAFVNDQDRLSFYGDFLFPLAENSSLENYYHEPLEGSRADSIQAHRKEIWERLHHFSMKLFCLSPADFIHLGSTRELLHFITKEIEDYSNLGWKKSIAATLDTQEFAAHNAFVEASAIVSSNSFIEDSYLMGNTQIGSHAIISSLRLEDALIPPDSVWHELTLMDGKYVVRIYGVDDNPKDKAKDGNYLGAPIQKFLDINGLKKEDLWQTDDDSLWMADLFPVCDSPTLAYEAACLVWQMSQGKASTRQIEEWRKTPRMSLSSSFNQADETANAHWQRELQNHVLCQRFISQLKSGQDCDSALATFEPNGITQDILDSLLAEAEKAEFALRIRILYTLSKYMQDHQICFGNQTDDTLAKMCFRTISNAVYGSVSKEISQTTKNHFSKDSVDVALPVRVNWGGGWTDTPPYCQEQGGMVLNAAIKLKGEFPIHVSVRKISRLHVEFESLDIHASGSAETIEAIQQCSDPFDPFTIHKAALIACGVIPIKGGNLQEILEKAGGGIYLSTCVVGVPKGSGLGTSSILAAACVRAIFELIGRQVSHSEMANTVLCVEQLMSTGGGWQDQIGGMSNGIKLASTEPGISQQIEVQHLTLSDNTKAELQQRFALIFSGQRRLARNLLREVIGRYIGNEAEAVNALHAMRSVTLEMKEALESSNIDRFAELLNQHWELSKQLDAHSTNTCIDQLFLACEDLIDGRFIAGAGGGGFLQVILKKGVTHQQLSDRINMVFQGSGAVVWDSEFIY